MRPPTVFKWILIALADAGISKEMDVAFRDLPGDTHPDHDTIATFRKRQAATVDEAEAKIAKGVFLQGCHEQVPAVTQQTTGNKQLVPLIEKVIANEGGQPQAVSAGTGYWSPGNVADPHVAGFDLHISAGKCHAPGANRT